MTCSFAWIEQSCIFSDAYFSFNFDESFFPTDVSKKTRKICQLEVGFCLQNVPSSSVPFYYSSSFTCAAVSNAS